MLSLLLSAQCICSPLVSPINLQTRTASITAQTAAPQLVRSFYKYHRKLDKCVSEHPIRRLGCSCCGLNGALKDFRLLLGLLPKQSAQEIAPCVLSIHLQQARRIQQAPIPLRLTESETAQYRKELRETADELMQLANSAISKHGLMEKHRSSCRVRSSPSMPNGKNK